jgi:hypothetical protein
MDGLKLLLLFARGAMEEKACGNNEFLEIVKLFLAGETSLKKEITKKIPLMLPTAWPALTEIGRRIGKNPLDFAAVADYVFKKHNLIASSDHCRVHTEKILKVMTERKELIVQSGGNKNSETIKFMPKTNGDFKEGDTVSFHRGWLICRMPV